MERPTIRSNPEAPLERKIEKKFKALGRSKKREDPTKEPFSDEGPIVRLIRASSTLPGVYQKVCRIWTEKKSLATNEEQLEFLNWTKRQMDSCYDVSNRCFSKLLLQMTTRSEAWLDQVGSKIWFKAKKTLNMFGFILRHSDLSATTRIIKDKCSSLSGFHAEFSYLLEQACGKSGLALLGPSLAGAVTAILVPLSFTGYGLLVILVGVGIGLVSCFLVARNEKQEMKNREAAIAKTQEKLHKLQFAWNTIGSQLDKADWLEVCRILESTETLYEALISEICPASLLAEKCSICFEGLFVGGEVFRPDSCAHHLFHTECLEQWETTPKDKPFVRNCPDCRKPYTRHVTIVK